MALEKWKTPVFFASAIILGICIAVVLYFYQALYTSERFLPGVQIVGVPVTGLTSDQAMLRLNQVMQVTGSAPVVFYHDDFSYQTSLEKIALPFDAGKAVREVRAKERQRGLRSKLLNLDGRRTIAYGQKVVYRPGPMGAMLQTFNQKLGIKTVDATLDMDPVKGLVIVPDSPGEVVDVNALMRDLPREWGEVEDLRIDIVMIAQQPSVIEEDLQGMGELSSFSTWFKTTEVNRSANLRLAAATLNGTMIKPGEVVSFNQIIGPRTLETGFNEAMVIIGDKFLPGVGGGICQVSSTLYNACLLAGLNIVERHHHNMAVGYVPLGRDATVSYGSQDFRFKNNTDAPIYIRAITSGGTITVNIYGKLTNKQKITLSSVIDATIPFKKVYLDDDTLSPGEVKVEHSGINGYTVRAFRTFYDANGKMINQEQLSINNYLTLDEIIHTGPVSNQPSQPVGDGIGTGQPAEGDQPTPVEQTGNNGLDNQTPAPETVDIVSEPSL